MSSFALLDQSLVRTVNGSLLLHPFLASTVYYIAAYSVYLIPVIWLGAWFFVGKKQRLILFSSIFAGLLGWQGFNRLLKLFFYHARPVQALGLKEVFFQRPENAFPSDHIAFLSAIAFFYLMRKQSSGTWLLLFSLLVGLARFAIAFHYLSDILAGFVVGYIAAWLVNFYHEKLSDSVWDYLLRLAHKFHIG